MTGLPKGTQLASGKDQNQGYFPTDADVPYVRLTMVPVYPANYSYR